MNLGGDGMSMSRQMANANTVRTAIKAVDKSSENMGLKIYNVSTMQKEKYAI